MLPFLTWSEMPLVILDGLPPEDGLMDFIAAS